VLLMMAAAAACTRSPVSGRVQLALITEAQEIDIGRRTAQEVVRTVGLLDDEQLQNYVQSIGEPLARRSERPHLPWSFRVIDEPTPNAFALPGGFILLTRGLMTLLNSEAELASVLAHEIGHVVARHAATAISRGQFASIGHGLGGALFPEFWNLGGLTGAGLELLLLGYGVDAERQADELGFRYAHREGYDARGMADALVSLQRLGELDQPGHLPGWLRTHPVLPERLEPLYRRLATLDLVAEALRVGGTAYLERLGGLVYGENPRAGMVRNGRFLHPAHHFQLAFPATWQVRSLPQAVMAVSPEGDAVLQLTLTGEPSASAAWQRFGRQPEILAGPVLREELNAMPAVVAEFQARTRHARMQGIAAFLGEGDRIYQVLAYAPVGVYADRRTVLREAVLSFERLTDPQLLALQPRRLEIVRVTEEMTLAEFQRRHPSVVSLRELAVLNGVEDGEAVLPAETRVKRVVGVVGEGEVPR
jgi:predicted Zn-dependent protease